jgi:hypothetical protein
MPTCLLSNQSVHAPAPMSGCGPAIMRCFVSEPPIVVCRWRPTCRCWFGAHLHGVPPLPDRELAELRGSVAALGAVGRNLNVIARVAHQTGRIEGLSTQNLRGILTAFDRLRIHFKALIETNIASWETGHAKKTD